MYWRADDLDLVLDLSFTKLADIDVGPAVAAMAALEAGVVANPDESRQVGHYWLRMPRLAPNGYGEQIAAARAQCLAIAAAAHRERVDIEDPDSDLRFDTLLVLGIGGSALGPQFVVDALGEPDDRLRVVFLDNTDPDGMARVLGVLDLESTLVVCISKSGGTAETANALVEVRAAFERAEVPFAPQAIAVSGEGSKLWHAAADWRARVPMWDWVGGRTSLSSAVGLLPMGLVGIDVEGFLDGAARMDVHTRAQEHNPALLLARAWYANTEGVGKRAMVVLPYRDRLALLSRYLQQLVMESIGKARALDGRTVHQGLTVYGNKGSTDQHAYVQQLREGPDDHFVTFVVVRDDGYPGQEDVDPGVNSGDYLQGFWLGTRAALAETGRASICISLPRVDARSIGALIALFERAVGYYASFVSVNAYHQPGVEAGKRAAGRVIAAQAALLAALGAEPKTAGVLGANVGLTESDAWHVLSRLAANERGVRRLPGASPAEETFCAE